MCSSLNDPMYACSASTQLIGSDTLVLVCLRFHSKLPQTGCSNSRALFSHSSRGWKCEIRERACLGSGDSLLPGLWRTMFLLYLCFVGVEWPRGEKFCPVTSLVGGIILIMIFLSSCPHVNKITAQRSRLQMSPQRVLGFQCRHGGDS